MAENWSSIDANPIKGRMRENVSLNIFQHPNSPIKKREGTHTHYSCNKIHQYPISLIQCLVRKHSPTQLLGKEILHPRRTYQLGICTRKTERIRQPRRMASHSKSGDEEALAEDHLTRESLAGRHVSVILDPRTTNGMELAGSNFLRNGAKKTGVKLCILERSE